MKLFYSLIFYLHFLSEGGTTNFDSKKYEIYKWILSARNKNNSRKVKFMHHLSNFSVSIGVRILEKIPRNRKSSNQIRWIPYEIKNIVQHSDSSSTVSLESSNMTGTVSLSSDGSNFLNNQQTSPTMNTQKLNNNIHLINEKDWISSIIEFRKEMYEM
jgi:hypothetical protein